MTTPAHRKTQQSRLQLANAIEGAEPGLRDEPVTRREILEALENVANEFGCAGFPENEAIAAAFRKLAEVLS